MGHLREPSGEKDNGIGGPHARHGKLPEGGQSAHLPDSIRHRVIGGGYIETFVYIYDLPIDGPHHIVLQCRGYVRDFFALSLPTRDGVVVYW